MENMPKFDGDNTGERREQDLRQIINEHLRNCLGENLELENVYQSIESAIDTVFKSSDQKTEEEVDPEKARFDQWFESVADKRTDVRYADREQKSRVIKVLETLKKIEEDQKLIAYFVQILATYGRDNELRNNVPACKIPTEQYVIERLPEFDRKIRAGEEVSTQWERLRSDSASRSVLHINSGIPAMIFKPGAKYNSFMVPFSNDGAQWAFRFCLPDEACKNLITHIRVYPEDTPLIITGLAIKFNTGYSVAAHCIRRLRALQAKHMDIDRKSIAQEAANKNTALIDYIKRAQKSGKSRKDIYKEIVALIKRAPEFETTKHCERFDSLFVEDALSGSLSPGRNLYLEQYLADRSVRAEFYAYYKNIPPEQKSRVMPLLDALQAENDLSVDVFYNRKSKSLEYHNKVNVTVGQNRIFSESFAATIKKQRPLALKLFDKERLEWDPSSPLPVWKALSKDNQYMIVAMETAAAGYSFFTRPEVGQKLYDHLKKHPEDIELVIKCFCRMN